MKKTAIIGLAFLAVVYTSCKDKSTGTQVYLSASDNDTTVKPGDDFYMYANGTWIKNAVIPETESSAGGFTDLYLRTQKNLENILKDLSSKNQTAGSIDQKVADFYASGMDSATIDKRGYDPVKPLLDKINTIKTTDDVLAFVVSEQKANQNLLSRWVQVPMKRTAAEISYCFIRVDWGCLTEIIILRPMQKHRT